jgi:hypothetical protein
VTLAHAMSNTVGGLMVIPNSYLLYANWALLIMVIPVVLIFGAKDLMRQKREEVVEQVKTHAMTN